MNSLLKFSLLFFLLSSFVSAQNIGPKNFHSEIIVSISNTLELNRTDESIYIELNNVLAMKSDFNKNAFLVYDNDKEIPSQLYTNGDKEYILFVTNINSKQNKELSIKYLPEGKLRKEYESRTYAELAMKFDAVYDGKKFVSDHFKNYQRVIVPEIHTDHDALFKYEGPGWESEKVGYRFYLDWRNATDIFGKKVNKLILNEVGVNDVVANNDSYHEMQEWGMDVFKVGSSLGIGSIGMMNKGKIEMVSNTDKVICEISANGPLISEVTTSYNGWQVNDGKYDLETKSSISAGSRITNVNLKISENAENITTGLAKHDNTNFIRSVKEGDWQYIALYGMQTLNNDNLGIVLFYNKSDLIELGEDELNYYVKLRPTKGVVKYGFAAAWEKEQNGISTEINFTNYINDEILKLNNPLEIELK